MVRNTPYHYAVLIPKNYQEHPYILVLEPNEGAEEEYIFLRLDTLEYDMVLIDSTSYDDTELNRVIDAVEDGTCGDLPNFHRL